MSRRDAEFEEVAFESIERETEHAWLVRFPDIDHPVWLPKSECEIEDETISVPDWLIVKHGIA